MNSTQNGQVPNPAPLKPAVRRRQLIVDLKSAQGRLDRSQERLKEIETKTPTAFFEIKQAKDVVSAARAIVELYALEVDKIDKGLS